MNRIHISTNKTHRAGIDYSPIDCSVCLKNTLYIGWVSLHCETCGYDSDQYTSTNILNIRRQTGLTRKQIAKELGYSKNTVKNYEFNHPSKVYFNKFNSYIAEFYE